MLAIIFMPMSKIVPESRDSCFLDESRENKISVIASIFSPFDDQDYKFIWFQSFLSLQAYLAPVIIIIATICYDI